MTGVAAGVRCAGCAHPGGTVVRVSDTTSCTTTRCPRCRTVQVADPPPADVLTALYADPARYAGYLAGQDTAGLADRHRRVLDRLAALTAPGRLVDVGAGAGDFLAAAATRGWTPDGCDVSPAAVDACAARHGIRLTCGGLDAVDGPADAVTMWCVLAHVTDPDRLLADAWRVLRPGGVLWLTTPRWSALDAAALVAARVGSARVFDRRINWGHLRLYTAAGMSAALRRAGFAPTVVRPAVEWSMRPAAYLRQLGVPTSVAGPVGAAVGAVMRSPAAPRNVLDVYARRV